MLLQFTVGNYRSFRERVTFSMMAEPLETGNGDSLLSLGHSADGGNAVSLAAVYGANASGKSNLLNAVDFLRRLVVDGTSYGQPIPVDRFVLDRTRDSPPSFFEIYFSLNGELYSYGIECDARQIHREWLRKGLEDVPLFARISDSTNVRVEVSDALKNALPNVMSRDRWQSIAEGTRPNQPFLTQAREQNMPSLVTIADWFRYSLVVGWPSLADGNATYHIRDVPQMVERLGGFLRAADTGIEEIGLHAESIESSELPDELQQIVESKTMFDSLSDAYLSVVAENDVVMIHRSWQDRTITRLRLQALHRGGDGAALPIEWRYESEGTRRLALVWQMIFMPLVPGRTLLIDEFERSLHPELMRAIVEQWRAFRPADCQLVFTTHNDNFLEDDLLRRDEVWFVEKDRTGSSYLTSEVEFKPIDGVTRQRAYLDGMYGGTPRIADRRFHWTKRGNI